VEWNYWSKYVIKMMIPLFVILVISLINFILAVRKVRSIVDIKKLFLISSVKEYMKKRFLPLLILLTVVMFAFLVSASLSPFKCMKVASDTYVMLDNPSLHCFDKDWNAHIALAVLFSLVYCCFLPGVLIYISWSSRDQLSSDDFQLKYGNLVQQYEEKFFWWEFVVALKKATFVLLGSILSSSRQEDDLFASGSILLVFLYLEIMFKPYKKHDNLIVSSMCEKI
jgi:hypothetical protein